MTRRLAPVLDDYVKLLDANGYCFPDGIETAAAKRTHVKPTLLIELICNFINLHSPGFPVRSSFLLNGYARVNGIPENLTAARHYAVLRLLTVDITSTASYAAAIDAHTAFEPRLLAYSTRTGQAEFRPGCLFSVLDFLSSTLDQPPAFETTTVKIATLGVTHAARISGYGPSAMVAELAMPEVPGIAEAINARPTLHESAARRRQCIEIEDSDLAKACIRVDTRENQPDWPVTLQRLNLGERMRALKVRSIGEHSFRRKGGYSFSGMHHAVGILSSRKTTFLWAIIFAVVHKHPGKRILVFAKDVVTAAAMDARLKRHGIRSTILASVHNRQRHLLAAHDHITHVPGATLAHEGDLSDSLPTGCALLGFQDEKPTIKAGPSAQAEWPGVGELPRRLCQNISADKEADGNKHCPYRVACPLHVQQRNLPGAQVVFATPASFLVTRPDPWIGYESGRRPDESGLGWTAERPLWLEVAQTHFDLALVDEADAVMRWYDEIFTQTIPLLRPGPENWAAAHRAATSRGLQLRSGAPFRNRVNAQYIDTESRLTNALARLYNLVEGLRDEWMRHVLRRRAVTGTALMVEYFWSGRPDHEVDRLRNAGTTEMAVITSVSTMMDAVAAFSQAESFRDEFSVRNQKTIDPKRPEASLRALAYAVPEIGAARTCLHDAAVLLRDDFDLFEAVAFDMLLPRLEHELAPFAWRLRPGSSSAPGMPGAEEARRRANVQDVLFAVCAEDLLRTFATHTILADAASDDFALDGSEQGIVGGQTIRRYKGLLPAGAANSVYGIRYDEGDADDAAIGGNMSVFSNFVPGRVALLELHSARAAEGYPGPAVLLLSGTSWSGGSIPDRRTIGDGHGGDEPVSIDAAAPVFDIQVPVSVLLEPPDYELAEMSKSIVAIERIVVEERGDLGSVLSQVRMSGARPRERAHAIEIIARHLATKGRGSATVFESRWDEAESAWGADLMLNRRRALCVTNNYHDSVAFADRLAQNLTHLPDEWQVFTAVSDEDENPLAPRPKLAIPLPRTLMEDFGATSERSILCAPSSVIDRGHNIVVEVPDSGGNRRIRAAISSVYYLHRTHPRPDDLRPTIARMNRFAVDALQNGIDEDDPKLRQFARQVASEPRAELRRNRLLRAAAQNIYQSATAWHHGYTSLSEEGQAQFAWNWLTSFWQTTGRLIRGGVPAQVVFIDRAFAPQVLGGNPDAPPETIRTSVLLRAKYELERAFNREPEIARPLYGPLHELLTKAADLIV